VANPTAFLAQKLLCHLERKQEKRAQDILYMHDTVRLFDRHLDTLRRLWLDEVLPSLRDRQRKDIEACRHQLVSGTTDTLRRAARIPADRQVRPEEMRRVLDVGFTEIFST